MHKTKCPNLRLSCETRLIPLTKGQVAVVDASDYEWLMQWSWTPWRKNELSTYYAVRWLRRSNGAQASIRMHRQIMGLDGPMVDHRDGDGLNNRRSNLRHCTSGQNNCNRGVSRNNVTGFKGVHWKKREQRYTVSISANGIINHLGYFDDPVIGAKAYDAEAIRLHGDFAKTNFKR